MVALNTYVTATATAALAAVAMSLHTGDRRTEYMVDDFVDEADDGDYALAIERAMRACDDDDGPTQSRGCTLLLTCGRVDDIKTTIDFCSSARVVGCGTARGLGGNVLRAVNDQTAVRVWHKNEACPLIQDVDVNPTVTFEHVAFANYDTHQSAPMFGIEARAPLVLRDVDIYGFTQGIHLDCSVYRAPATGCSLSHFDGVWSRMNEHAGVYVIGSDANASMFAAVNSMSNCRYASEWNDLLMLPYCRRYPTMPECALPCGNIMDGSFLGNTWIGPHTASARDISTIPATAYPGVVNAGYNNRSVWVGLYTEMDQPASWLAPNANAIGGIHQFSNIKGMDINGVTISSAQFYNTLDPNNITLLKLGMLNNDMGTFMSLYNPDDSWALRWTYDRVLQRYFWDLGNTGNRPIQVTKQCSGGGCGKLILGQQQ